MKWRTLAVLALAGGLSACASPANNGNLPLNRALAGHTSGLEAAPAYHVEPPDELLVSVADHPDLEAKVTVRPDGRISLPLLGDVRVWGLTVSEVRDRVQRGYSRYLRNGSVTVQVTGFNSKSIYVYGEVEKPGAYPYTGSDTVVDVLARAGTLNWRASPDSIQVTRGDARNPTTLDVSLTDIVEEDVDVTNYHLHQNDIVWVPPAFMVQVGDAVRRVMWPFVWLLAPADAYLDYATIRELRHDD